MKVNFHDVQVGSLPFPDFFLNALYPCCSGVSALTYDVVFGAHAARRLQFDVRRSKRLGIGAFVEGERAQARFAAEAPRQAVHIRCQDDILRAGYAPSGQ